MSLCFFICEMGVMLPTVGIKCNAAQHRAVSPHCEHLINAGSAAAVPGEGARIGGQLELVTNILASRPEDLDFSDEETDSEKSLDDGQQRGAWNWLLEASCSNQRSGMTEGPQESRHSIKKLPQRSAAGPRKGKHTCPKWPWCPRGALRGQREERCNVEAKGTA